MEEKNKEEVVKKLPLLERYIQSVILEEHRIFEEEMMQTGPISVLKGQPVPDNKLH